MTSLHQKLSEDILRLVQSGVLRIGEKLPPEADYAAQLGVSRSTLRLAFAELERLGVLTRKKRAGTRIVSQHPKPQFNMNTSGLHELLSLGRDTELAIAAVRSVTSAQSVHLAGYRSIADSWLEVSGTRTLCGQTVPFNSTRIYVPGHYAGIGQVLGATETSVFRIIERTYGVSIGRVSQTAKAIASAPKVAAVLGLVPGAPVLQIVAELWTRDGVLMEISVATFDPDRFQLRTEVEIE